MDDVRGLFLRMPHGTTPAAVTTNKNIIISSFKSSGNIRKRKRVGQTAVSDNQSSSVTLNKLAKEARKERLDGVYWLLIFGIFLLLILIFALKFYWPLIFWMKNLTIKPKIYCLLIFGIFLVIDTDFWPKILLITYWLTPLSSRPSERHTEISNFRKEVIQWLI